MLYLLAYELAGPLAHYAGLVRFIDACSAQAHVMDNLWLLERSDLPSNFERELRACLQAGDRFCIVDISKSVIAWSGLEGELAEFIGRFTEAVPQDVVRSLLLVAYDGSVAIDDLQPVLRHLWQLESGLRPESVAASLRGHLGEGGRLVVADISLAPAVLSHADAAATASALAYTRSQQGAGERQEF